MNIISQFHQGCRTKGKTCYKNLGVTTTRGWCRDLQGVVLRVLGALGAGAPKHCGHQSVCQVITTEQERQAISDAVTHFREDIKSHC